MSKLLSALVALFKLINPDDFYLNNPLALNDHPREGIVHIQGDEEEGRRLFVLLRDYQSDGIIDDSSVWVYETKDGKLVRVYNQEYNEKDVKTIERLWEIEKERFVAGFYKKGKLEKICGVDFDFSKGECIVAEREDKKVQRLALTERFILDSDDFRLESRTEVLYKYGFLQVCTRNVTGKTDCIGYNDPLTYFEEPEFFRFSNHVQEPKF